MKYLRGPKYPKLKQEIEEIKSSISAIKPNFCTIIKQLFCDKSTLVPFLLLLYLFIYQQTGGSGPLAAYIGPIFFEIGLPFPNLIAAFALGGVTFIGAFISIVSIEYAGRKLLLAISSFGMLVGSLILSVQFYLTQPSLCNNSTILEVSPDSAMNCNANVYPMAIAGVILFVFSFATGVAPVPWVLTSEYLPLNVRGIAGGFVTAIPWAFAAVTTGTFLNLSEAIGTWVVWLMLSVYHLLSFFIILLFFLETKGKKLEDVQEMFSAKLKCSTCHKEQNSE